MEHPQESENKISLIANNQITYNHTRNTVYNSDLISQYKSFKNQLVKMLKSTLHF